MEARPGFGVYVAVLSAIILVHRFYIWYEMVTKVDPTRHRLELVIPAPMYFLTTSDAAVATFLAQHGATSSILIRGEGIPNTFSSSWVAMIARSDGTIRCYRYVIADIHTPSMRSPNINCDTVPNLSRLYGRALRLVSKFNGSSYGEAALDGSSIEITAITQGMPLHLVMDHCKLPPAMRTTFRLFRRLLVAPIWWLRLENAVSIW
jgi:hypothetical protein